MFEKLPKIHNVYFLACVATMGGMLFGFDISSMSAIIGTKQYLYGLRSRFQTETEKLIE